MFQNIRANTSSILFRCNRDLVFPDCGFNLRKPNFWFCKMIPSRAVVAALPLARRALALNSPCVSAMTVRLSHEGPPANYRHPTMDDLPVPCGNWQENYDNNQRKYNIILLLGFGFFMITCSVGFYTGAFDLHLMAPKRPSFNR